MTLTGLRCTRLIGIKFRISFLCLNLIHTKSCLFQNMYVSQPGKLKVAGPI